MPFEAEEKDKIFLESKENAIEITAFKLSNPEEIEKLEIETKKVILLEYKPVFYAFSNNHLYVYYKGKKNYTKLSGTKKTIKNLDDEQVDKIKNAYQTEMRKLVIDETLIKPILELNDREISTDLESDILFVSMNKFFKNFRKLINNLNEHIDNIRLLQGYKEDTAKLLKDIKEIDMKRPRLSDFPLDKINLKCIEFGNFKDNVMKDLENLLNTYNSYGNFINMTDKYKNIIPKEFNITRLNDIKFTKKEIGFGSFDLNISTPYLSLSTDNTLQFCLKAYNQDINCIIPSLYHGEIIKFNIISFIDKSIKSSLNFSENNLITKQLSINSITKPNEPIIIKFEIPFDIALEEEEYNKVSGELNFELIEEKDMSLQIPFNFNFEFIPLKIIFESNNGFFFKENNLKYANEFSPLDLEISLSFKFEKSNLLFDKWKNNYSIEKLEGNQLEEEPELIFKEDKQEFLLKFSKYEKKLNNKKLNAKITFYITKNLTIPIQISTTFIDKRFVFASVDDVQNILDYDYFHIYLYEEVGEQIVTFRIEYEDDSPHSITVSDNLPNGYVSFYGVYIHYLEGNIFNFKKGRTFKLKFTFNKRSLQPDKLKNVRIYVQNEKYIFKSLIIKLHMEDDVSFGKAIFNSVKNIFSWGNVDERYCKIPHIGYNYTLKKYKIVEHKEKMSDYIKDEKKLTV